MCLKCVWYICQVVDDKHASNLQVTRSKTGIIRTCVQNLVKLTMTKVLPNLFGEVRLVWSRKIPRIDLFPLSPKAAAWAPASGFESREPEPQAAPGRPHSSPRLGYPWLRPGRPAASSQASHITNSGFSFVPIDNPLIQQCHLLPHDSPLGTHLDSLQSSHW